MAILSSHWSQNSTPAHGQVGEERFLLRNVGWDGYVSLLDWFGDDAPRMTYVQGDLEFMSPLNRHEQSTKFLGYMVETIAEELGIRLASFRSTTLTKQSVDRGVEADECYYFANIDRLLGGKKIDLEIEPPPDLCLEIEISNSLLPKLEAYALIGVPEIWRFDGKSLTVLVLDPDGQYIPSERSLSLPFVPMGTISRFISEIEVGQELPWRRRFRAWVREVLAPQYLDGQPEG